MVVFQQKKNHLFSKFSSMASTVASNVLLAYLLLGHSISSRLKSNSTWRLNWRLSNLFNFGIPDLILLVKARLALCMASKLGGTALSQKFQGSEANMIKKGLEAVLEAWGIFRGQTIFLNKNYHRI